MMMMMMRRRMRSLVSVLTPIQLLQASFFCLVTLTLTLHALPSSPKWEILLLLSSHRAVLFAIIWCTLVALWAYLSFRRHPVLLLDYACYKPDHDRTCPYEVCEYFVRRSRRFSTTSVEFMRGIYLKSGLGDQTYAPPFIFQTDYEARLRSAVQEAEEGMISAVDAVLAKTRIPASAIGVVIVTSGSFASSPSLAALLVRHYRLPENVKAYNLSGMGCSSGVLAVDLAAGILRGSRKVQTALVVATESISLNWYFGDDRSMLVTNCIFRVGAAAALLTNDPAARSRGDAKMELLRSLRSHHGADDASYRAAFQQEDEAGNLGVSLKKDLVRVAGEGLRAHIRQLAPLVLPWAQLALYAYREVGARLGLGGGKPHVPDFTTAFEHMCVHTGGKAVIQSVGRLLRLGDEVTEPARMCLHRFGNTSSSLVFYELAYFEAKGRVRAGDRIWMLAFGTGFKVCTLVWRALRESSMDDDNPWKDCIHRYPVKAW